MSKRKDDVAEQVKKLREAGFTFQRIGEMLGLTRQRVHQIYKKVSPRANYS